MSASLRPASLPWTLRHVVGLIWNLLLEISSLSIKLSTIPLLIVILKFDLGRDTCIADEVDFQGVIVQAEGPGLRR